MWDWRTDAPEFVPGAWPSAALPLAGNDTQHLAERQAHYESEINIWHCQIMETQRHNSAAWTLIWSRPARNTARKRNNLIRDIELCPYNAGFTLLAGIATALTHVPAVAACTVVAWQHRESEGLLWPRQSC